MFKDICKQTDENLKRLSKNKKIVIWGFVREKIEQIMTQYSNFECIVDSDSERWGIRFESLEVYPPEHLYALDSETHIVLIASGTGTLYSVTRAIKMVDDFSVFYFSAISDKFFNYFSNQLYENLEKINNVEKMLADDRSRKIYREVVRRRIMGATGEFKSLKINDNPQYIFPPMFQGMGNDEVFLDCGGYIGDSVEKFVTAFGNKVKKIYSFECLKENIPRLQKAGNNLKSAGWTGELVIAPYAVSNKNTEMVFHDIGKPESGYLPEMRSTVQYNEKLAPVNTFQVDARTIDDFVPQNEKISLIKMDIEGGEYAALKGAERTIRKYEPRLAISIYHNPSDYWRICQLIHSFSANYKFAVRHHQNNHLDTVFYAWREEA